MRVLTLIPLPSLKATARQASCLPCDSEVEVLEALRAVVLKSTEVFLSGDADNCVDASSKTAITCIDRGFGCSCLWRFTLLTVEAGVNGLREEIPLDPRRTHWLGACKQRNITMYWQLAMYTCTSQCLLC